MGDVQSGVQDCNFDRLIVLLLEVEVVPDAKQQLVSIRM